MSVTVRPATEEDVSGIGRVARAAYEEVYPPILGEDVKTLLERWYSSESLRESLANPESETFVAVDRRVVGFASAGAPEGESVGALGSLYVHPERWGEGIGRRLVERARRHLVDRGVERMEIAVFADNEVGNGFYEAFAQRVDRETHDLVGREVAVNVYAVDLESYPTRK